MLLLDVASSLLDACRCLILAPTRELAKQVAAEFESICPSLTVVSFYGGTSINAQVRLQKQRAGLKQQHCRVHLHPGQWAQAAAPLEGRGEDAAAVAQAADRAASGTSSSCAPAAGGAGACVMPHLLGAEIEFPCCTVAASCCSFLCRRWTL